MHQRASNDFPPPLTPSAGSSTGDGDSNSSVQGYHHISLPASIAGHDVWDRHSMPTARQPQNAHGDPAPMTPTSSDESCNLVEPAEDTRRGITSATSTALGQNYSLAGRVVIPAMHMHSLSTAGKTWLLYIVLPGLFAFWVLGRGSLVCEYPFLNRVGLWDSSKCDQSGAQVDFPGVMRIQTHLEGVLGHSVGGIITAHGLKKSQMAASDLNSLVKFSDLSCK
jgi:hypothetical protein